MTTDLASDLSHRFLVAMPELFDINFVQSVIYLFDHNDSGATGLIINKPTSYSVSDFIRGLDIDITTDEDLSMPIYQGGPVQTDAGFVIHSNETHWPNTLASNEQLSVSTSKEIVEAIASGEGPQEFIITLGYAGWGAEQLIQELSENVWISTPAERSVLFQCPATDKWQQAARLIGLDFDRLSSGVGHS